VSNLLESRLQQSLDRSRKSNDCNQVETWLRAEAA